MLENTGSSRRITEQLMVYWDALRGAKAFPDFEKLEPEGIEGLWQHCFLLVVSQFYHVDDFEFSYIGEDVVTLFGEEVNTPKMLPFSEQILARYKEVLERKSAIIEEGEFENARGQLIKYRQILLPFGDGETVTHILGGIRSKVEELS